MRCHILDVALGMLFSIGMALKAGTAPEITTAMSIIGA
jgi:hypothetical protein